MEAILPLKDAWVTHPLCCELPKEVRHRESFREALRKSALSQFSRKSVVSGNLETFAGRKKTMAARLVSRKLVSCTSNLKLFKILMTECSTKRQTETNVCNEQM